MPLATSSVAAHYIVDIEEPKITRNNQVKAGSIEVDIRSEVDIKHRNDKNCSLSIVLTAVDQKLQKS